MNATPFDDWLNRLLNRPHMGLLLSLSVLFILYIPVFTTNYAYLDEAYQLWHNRDHSNFYLDLVQGRWLTGMLYDKFFSSIPSVSSLKILRVISFFSWALFLEEFYRLGKKWQRWIGFDTLLLTISGLYISCSISVAIYIGWGVLFEIGAASLLGLWSGHLLFSLLMEPIPALLFRILLLIFSALGALFLYQTAFGAFLIPFALYLLFKGSATPFRFMLWGAGVYLILILGYYPLFLYSLKLYSVSASDRTSISFDLPGKLGFFFSAPLSEAFSLNFLYNMHSILSQAFPILAIIGWLIVFIKKDKGPAGKKIGFVFSFIALCMLIYLPVLVAKENFAPYRTMFVLNLVVTFLLIDVLLSLAGRLRYKYIGAATLLCCFIGVGFQNFRYNFIDPLRDEYALLNRFFNTRYNPSIQTIYFLRPAEGLFYPIYGINSFKDEFGLPSTFKDWTPEPLMNQLIMERTRNRQTAERTKLIQFTDRAAFTAEENNPQPDALYIDIASIFHDRRP